MDRVGPKAKLPVPFLHEAELFTTPVGVAAKLCTGAAAEDGLGEAFCRRRCITVETVSDVGHLLVMASLDRGGHRDLLLTARLVSLALRLGLVLAF